MLGGGGPIFIYSVWYGICRGRKGEGVTFVFLILGGVVGVNGLGLVIVVVSVVGSVLESVRLES